MARRIAVDSEVPLVHLEVPGFDPRSTSAVFTQPCNDSTPTPSWRATLGITPVLLPSFSSIAAYTIRTPRSRSSGGYRRCVGCTLTT